MEWLNGVVIFAKFAGSEDAFNINGAWIKDGFR